MNRFFEKNEGPKDRIIRAVLGVVTLGMGYTHNSLWYILSAILLVTAATGFCLIYKPFKINTLRSQKELTTKKSKLKSQVIDRISTLSTAAFGLIAALAWNDAIKGLFAEGGPLHAISTKGPWAYALIVTIIAAIVTIWIGKISEKSK